MPSHHEYSQLILLLSEWESQCSNPLARPPRQTSMIKRLRGTLKDFKQCCRCNTHQRKKFFYNSAVSKDGKKPYCKACALIYAKEYAKTPAGIASNRASGLRYRRKNPNYSWEVSALRAETRDMSKEDLLIRKREKTKLRQRKWAKRQKLKKES